MQTKLHLSFDTETREIQFSTEVTDTLYQGGQATIDFRILGRDAIVPIERLVFGYSIYDVKYPEQSDELVIEEIFPKGNDVYVATDQNPLAFRNIVFTPTHNYRIDNWYNYNQDVYKKSFSFTVGKTVQPYESWSWNAENLSWEAPIPMPTDTASRPQWVEQLGYWVVPDSGPDVEEGSPDYEIS